MYFSERLAEEEQPPAFHPAPSTFRLSAVLRSAYIIDKQELYSEHLRRQYREFQQMDGTECNPVVFIQKFKVIFFCFLKVLLL